MPLVVEFEISEDAGGFVAEVLGAGETDGGDFVEEVFGGLIIDGGIVVGPAVALEMAGLYFVHFLKHSIIVGILQMPIYSQFIKFSHIFGIIS